MKTITVKTRVYLNSTLIILATTLAACRKPGVSKRTAEVSTAPETVIASSARVAPPTPEPPPIAPPTTTITETVPEPATPHPVKIVNNDPYFLLATVMIDTGNGIVTPMPPGTSALRQPDGRFVVANQFIVLRPEQVTRDLRAANAAARASAAINTTQPAAPKSPAPLAEDIAAVLKEAMTVPVAPALNTSTPEEVARKQRIELEAQMKSIREEISSIPYSGNAKTSPNAFANATRRKGLEDQLTDLRKQLDQLRTQQTLITEDQSARIAQLNKEIAILNIQAERLSSKMSQIPYGSNSDTSPEALHNQELRTALKKALDECRRKIQTIREQQTLIRLGK